jgi:hypothetical protein
MSNATNISAASIAENPEYQALIQRLLSVPPAVRALVNLSDADKAYMGDLEQTNLQLQKIGAAKSEFEGKAALIKEKNAADKAYGLGGAQTYYNWKTTAARDVLDLEKSANATNNLLGVASVGAGIYGLNTQNTARKQLLDKYGLT